MLKIIEKYFYSPKYVVVFLREFQNTMIVERKMVFKTIERLKKVNKTKFTITDVENPAYSHMNKRFFFVSHDGSKTYSFVKTNHAVSSEEIDLIVGNHIIREITKGLMDDSKTKLMYIGIGGIIGLIAGAFITNLFMQNKISKLYQEWIDSQPTIIGMFRLIFRW